MHDCRIHAPVPFQADSRVEEACAENAARITKQMAMEEKQCGSTSSK
jgi:hypothetical protein